MKNLVLAVVGFLLVGCGGGGAKLAPATSNGTPSGSGISDPTQQAQTLQNGQWEFTFPTGTGENVPPAYMEANLQVTDQAVAASMQNVMGYAPYYNQATASQYDQFPGGYVFESNGAVVEGSTSSGLALTVSNQETGETLSTLTAPLTGSLVTSVSGTVNIQVTGQNQPWSFEGGLGNGTFTATAISPVNGSYSGTLKTLSGGNDQVSFSVSQNVYNVTLTGSGSGNGNSISFSISSVSVTGAVFTGTGTMTTANGSQQFSIGAHIHPDGNSIDIVLSGAGSAGCGCFVESGTITKAGQ
jgi:hypothetical protein